MFGLQHKVCFSMFFRTVHSPILFHRKPGPGGLLNFSVAKGLAGLQTGPLSNFQKRDVSVNGVSRSLPDQKRVLLCQVTLLALIAVSIVIFSYLFFLPFVHGQVTVVELFLLRLSFPQYLCSLFHTFHTVFFLGTFHMSAIFNAISPPKAIPGHILLVLCFFWLEVVVVNCFLLWMRDVREMFAKTWD